jgi:ribose transport system substrate-binding protein
MSRFVRNAVLAFFVLGCFNLTGCQYRSKKDTYYLIAANLKLPYWKSVQDGFNQAAAEYGVTARVGGPDTYDPVAEVDAFRNAAATRPAGILISAADANALRPEIDNAIGAGIPVITVDSDAAGSSRLYFIGTNNLQAGHIGGQRLVERLKGKGNVVVYSITGQPNLDERLKGYMDIVANSPGIKIVDVFSTHGDVGRAFDQTEEYVHRTGAAKIDAFVSLESASGAAIGEVLKRNGITDRVVIAMDAEPETLQFVNDGTIDSTIAQKPFTMGYVGLEALDQVHHQHIKEFLTTYAVVPTSPFPAFIDTGSALVTKYNVGLFLHPSGDLTQ